MKVLKTIVSPIAGLVGLLTPKAPELPGAPPPATRDAAREAVANDDRLRRRRGGAADIVTGAGGAEAGRGGKDTLGS